MNLPTRDDLGKLINALRLKRGVELGSARGSFADRLLSTSALESLTCVDKWNDTAHPLTEKTVAQERLARHGARATIVHTTFREALSLFADASLDFIYVDGYAHTGQQNGQTMLEWWNKLRDGGVFAGHDYHAKWPLTVSAVNRFAALAGLPIFLTREDIYPSWIMFKPREGLTTMGETLMPALEGSPVSTAARCILVGNGPSLLDADRGAVIDSFDEVVRFNEFRTAGVERHTGGKTTLWATYRRNMIPREGKLHPRILYAHGNNGNPSYPPDQLWRIPSDYYKQLQTRIQSESRLPESERKSLLPSCGFLVLNWLLENGAGDLTLAGFDHFSRVRSTNHHYWRKGSFGRPPEHDGEYEAADTAKLIATGKVAYLP